MSPDLVYLVADGGAVIGFTVPLSEHVEKQWAAGELVRVHEDGTGWDAAEDEPCNALAAMSDPTVGIRTGECISGVPAGRGFSPIAVTGRRTR